MANNHPDIERYLNGELSPAEMHALEKKALYDPFLADALEGAGQLAPTELSADLQQLQASLRQASQKTVPGVSLRVWALRIAATLLLLAVATAIIVRIVSTPDERLALQTPPHARQEEGPAPTRPQADSVVTSPSKPGVVASKSAEENKTDEPRSFHVSSASDHTSTPSPVADAVVPEVYLEKQQPVVAEVQEAPPAAPKAELETETTDADDRTKRKRESPVMRIADKNAEKKEDLAYTTPATLPGFTNGASTTRPANALNYSVPSTKTVYGKVTLSDDGTGIPGVNVMVVGSDLGTVTDINGNYQIRVEDEKNATLAFSFIGMQSKEMPLGDAEKVDVQLDQDVSQLSEVVVTGFGTDNGPLKEDLATFQLATPAGGRGAFKQYLETNMHYPEQALANEVEGKVTIQFTVESSGRVTDFKVLKGLGYGCDEEVIRLIKNGPKWQPSKRADEPVKDNVKVRMKFRLPKKK